ncbi:MAG TPA: NAD(P)/FAD-dependent oxidoreductase, partial [Steroidobacteraceae bacterium]
MSRYTIIGAGPVGALMGLMLARRGQRVRLIERRPDPRTTAPEVGRSINLALAARGTLALEHVGLSNRVAPEMISMPGRMLHDQLGALQFLPYGQNEQEVIYAISRERLNRILIEAAAENPNIELCFNTRCIDVDAQRAELQLRDEAGGTVRRERFELLLAADGAGSAVRAALLARGQTRVEECPLAHDYKELTIAAPQVAAAGRYAFEPHALHIWPRGGFMLIALPNIDGSFTATLFLPRRGVHGFDGLENGAAVRAFFQHQFPDAAAAIADLEQQFVLHPQSQLGSIYCDGWQVAGRVLLLGDAAHAIVPFHGQGLNCGFEDCRVLDRLLAGALQPGIALAEFERERRPNTDAIAAMALENYIEMRDGVRAPQFALRKQLAGDLEREFPGRFIPRYSMVMFHPEIPYAEAQRRGVQQERLLDRLVEQFGYQLASADARAYVR